MYLPFPIYDYADLAYVTMQRWGFVTGGIDVMRSQWGIMFGRSVWRTEYG